MLLSVVNDEESWDTGKVQGCLLFIQPISVLAQMQPEIFP